MVNWPAFSTVTVALPPVASAPSPTLPTRDAALANTDMAAADNVPPLTDRLAVPPVAAPLTGFPPALASSRIAPATWITPPPAVDVDGGAALSIVSDTLPPCPGRADRINRLPATDMRCAWPTLMLTPLGAANAALPPNSSWPTGFVALHKGAQDWFGRATIAPLATAAKLLAKRLSVIEMLPTPAVAGGATNAPCKTLPPADNRMPPLAAMLTLDAVSKPIVPDSSIVIAWFFGTATR